MKKQHQKTLLQRRRIDILVVLILLGVAVLISLVLALVFESSSNIAESYTTSDSASYACFDVDNCAQRFTIGTTGENVSYNLTGTSILAYREGTLTTANFSIWTNVAGKNVTCIASQTKDVSGIALTTSAWYNFTLPNITLQKGTSYWFWIASAATSGNHIRWRVDASGSGYTGGGLYAGGYGGFVADGGFMFQVWGVKDYSLNITLNYPANNANFITRNIPFNCTANATIGTIQNVSLYLNNALNYTTIGSSSFLTLNTTINSFVVGTHNWTCKARDNSNNLIETSDRNFTIKSFNEASQSYNASSYEMKTEGFVINMSYDKTYFSSASANFIYNGTIYSGTKLSDNGDTIFAKSLSIPSITGTSIINNTFYWNVILTTATGTTEYANSTFYNQSIIPIVFTKCNATYPVPIVNYTTYNETSKTLINASFDGVFNYRTTTGTNTKNYTYSVGFNNGTLDFCSSINDTLVVDLLTAKITNTGFKTRTFYFNDENYNNITTTRKMYLLESGGGSDIIVSVSDSGLVPYENIYVEISRFYPGTNEYEIVERGKSDIYGQIVANLIENDVKYKFIFRNESNYILKQTGDITIACRSTICILPFVIEDTTDYFNKFENITDYDWTFDFAANIFTFTWNDVSGVTATNRLEVNRYLWNGTSTICNSTSTDTSGVLTCNTLGVEASYIAQVFRKISGGSEVRIAELSQVIDTTTSTYGREGLLWSFFILMTMLAFGFWKPTVGIVFYLFTVLVLMFTKIVYINPYILFAEFLIGIAFIWAFSKR